MNTTNLLPMILAGTAFAVLILAACLFVMLECIKQKAHEQDLEHAKRLRTIRENITSQD